MKKYEPSKTDDEFEEWWYSVYKSRPTMIQRQCYEAGYFAGQSSNMYIVSALLAAMVALGIILFIKL